MKLVISDTSPIRAFHNAKLLHVLKALFDQIIVPPAVFNELTRPTSTARPVAPDQLQFCQVVTPSDRELLAHLDKILDVGESEAIALAVEFHADELLMDEKAGRRIAGTMNLKVTGVVAILIKAKDAQLIPAVMPILDELRNKFQFYVADAIVHETRLRAGE